MINRRRLLILAGACSLVALVLAGWLWADRGVGIGLRRHAQEVLARYDGAAPDAGAPNVAVATPSPPSGKFLPGVQVESATTTTDGVQLTVEFTGAAPGSGPCERDYHVEAFESASAVVVVLEGKSRDILEQLNLGGGTDMCLSLGYLRTARVVLAQPLGSRAVLDGRSGEPVRVVVSG